MGMFLLKDLPGTCKKIADFLGHTLTKEAIDRICDHCRADSMRNNDMVNLSYWRNVKDMKINDEGGFINKGCIPYTDYI